MAGKVKSSSNKAFVSGGKGHMFGRSGASPMQPGQTAASGGKSGGKFAKGGKGHMFGKQTAGAMPSGRTGK